MKNKQIIYRHGNHSVGLAHVHLVWIPKRRKRVLVGQVKIRLAAILSEVATEKGWLIKGLEIAPDHVHILVEHGSDVAIHKIVKALKGRSSRLLRLEFPELCKLPSLWTHSYFYDTTGKVSTAKILEYINDPHHGGFNRRSLFRPALKRRGYQALVIFPCISICQLRNPVFSKNRVSGLPAKIRCSPPGLPGS